MPETLNTEKGLPNDIKTLQAAQQSPNALMDFQKVLASVSRNAYAKRQESETANLGFNPSEVSGDTFSSIISDFESKRGADVGKIYASTLNAYASAQEQVTNRLQFLQQLKQAKDQFKAELKLKKQQLKVSASADKRNYSLSLKELNQKQVQWEKEFSRTVAKAQRVIDNQSDVPDWAQ